MTYVADVAVFVVDARLTRVVCLANAAIASAREWQGSCSRHHHHPIPSARGEARRVCQRDTAAAPRVRL